MVVFGELCAGDVYFITVMFIVRLYKLEHKYFYFINSNLIFMNYYFIPH